MQEREHIDYIARSGVGGWVVSPEAHDVALHKYMQRLAHNRFTASYTQLKKIFRPLSKTQTLPDPLAVRVPLPPLMSATRRPFGVISA